MNVRAALTGGHRARLAFGLTLCVLLMIFAVATKAAAYHHQDRVRALTHTKVWQNNQDASAVAAPHLQLDMLFAVVALLLLPLLKTPQIHSDQRTPFSSGWYVPLLAVRPPPAR